VKNKIRQSRIKRLLKELQQKLSIEGSYARYALKKEIKKERPQQNKTKDRKKNNGTLFQKFSSFSFFFFLEKFLLPPFYLVTIWIRVRVHVHVHVHVRIKKNRLPSIQD